MQIVAPIGISDQTKKLFQVYKNGILMATLNADDQEEARQTCANNYSDACLVNYFEFQALEILRS